MLTSDSAAPIDSSARRADAIPWRAWAGFTMGALILYGLLYAWSESLVYQHAEHNRFFAIQSTPPQQFDWVILGASHAMPLGYGDSNQRLEKAAGGSVMNISSEGAGVLPNRLMYEYFLTRHQARQALYVVDAFVFYDRRWNEDRMDAGMLNRAPLDPELATVFWDFPWARDLLPIYLSGFGKINNADRFAPDVPEGAKKFDTVYHPISQIDRQRMLFLFPNDREESQFERYLAAFEELAEAIAHQGMDLIVVVPPTPPRYRDALPDTTEFQEAMARMEREGRIIFHDLSTTVTEDRFFYDTDHLNRDGTNAFIDGYLAPLLRSLQQTSRFHQIHVGSPRQ